ncbi:MAG: DUF177 domain-containing protein [Tissierellia bacterium]|nr:DUF177 domain-containing protein [Tissierellia bacterium]
MKEQLRDLARGVITQIELNERLMVETPFDNRVEVEVKGAFTREGKQILLRFLARAVEDQFCSRCLGDTKFLYEIPYEEVVEMEDIETFDLSEVVRQELQMAAPLRVLCDEECLGLCPYCGINLNEATCDCRSEQIDPRLSALKRLLDE